MRNQRNRSFFKAIVSILFIALFIATSAIGSFAAIKREAVSPADAIPKASTTAAVKESDIPVLGFLWPAPKSYTISSPYNLHSATLQAKRGSLHGGIDIAGTFTVVAARSGKVIKVVNSGTNGGTACEVVLEHTANGSKFYTRYLHFRSGSVVVREGQYVKACDKLGTSGSTGLSTGNHLHFEISRVPGYSKKATDKFDPNPNSSLGIKYNSTYSGSACQKEINGHARICYTFNKDEAIQLDAFQETRSAVSKPYFISKAVTLRTYPADAAPKGPSLKAGDIVVILESGRNNYNNTWYKVRRLNDSKQYYVYSSYIGKQVTSSTLAKPAFSGGTLSVSFLKAKTVKIDLKSAAPSGCTYVAVYTCGSKRKTATFTTKSFEYNVGSIGVWTVQIYTQTVDSSFRVSSASISKTVIVLW